MLRKLSLLLLALIVAIPTAHADDASKRTKIIELFKVMQLDQTMQQVMQMSYQQGQQFAANLMGNRPVSDADKALLDDLDKRTYALVSEYLAWDKLQPDYVTLYWDNFTEPEIDAILTFYNSPAGKALVQKTPALLSQSQALVMSHAKEMQTRMQALFEDFRLKLEAAHPADKNK